MGAVQKQPGIAAIGRRHDGGRQLAAVRPGGIQAVGVERGRVHRAAEIDLRPLGDADVAAAVVGRDAGDGERRQCIHLQAAGQRAAVAGGVACGEGQAVVAGAQITKGQRCIKAAGAGVEDQVVGGATIHLPAQLGEAAAGGAGRSGQAAGRAEGVAIGHAVQRDDRRAGVPA